MGLLFWKHQERFIYLFITFCSLLKSPAAQEACTWLDSVLGKNSLLQKELDLSMMETGDSGVEKLSALLEDSHCKFQKIR